jgi:hypothetical protein
LIAGKILKENCGIVIIDGHQPLVVPFTCKVLETVVKVEQQIKAGDILCYIEILENSTAESKAPPPGAALGQNQALVSKELSRPNKLDDYKNAYLKFVRIGVMLSEDAVVKRFEQFIDQIFIPEVSSAFPAPAFCFILASSGFGKSQFPFALVRRPILYIPLSSSQDIYAHFSYLTSLFHACVVKDINIHFPEKPIHPWPYSCSQLTFIVTKPLYTIGALYTIFSQMKDTLGVFDPTKIEIPSEIVPMSSTCLSEKHIVF